MFAPSEGKVAGSSRAPSGSQCSCWCRRGRSGTGCSRLHSACTGLWRPWVSSLLSGWMLCLESFCSWVCDPKPWMLDHWHQLAGIPEKQAKRSFSITLLLETHHVCRDPDNTKH